MMKLISISTFFLAALVLVYCSSSTTKEISEVSKPSEEEISEGQKLAKAQCYACHSPTASQENRLAPPMVAISEHYIDSKTTFEDFSNDFIAFVHNPSEEKSKMPGALKRFGLMAAMPLDKADLRKIAAYLYYGDVEKPDWFDAHRNKEHASAAVDLTPLEYGKELALKTKSVLGKNLMKAINSQGTEHALSFCSTRALHLTDSVAQTLNASIKRVSDQNRNPKNNANTDELRYIKSVKALIARGDEPKPTITEKNGKMIGYYPILANQMCLQCHGQPNKDVKSGTLAKIMSLYPNDKALGYESGDLRGIWAVSFDKKSQ
jgi:cytochrome c553